jgi:hypothetical protein
MSVCGRAAAHVYCDKSQCAAAMTRAALQYELYLQCEKIARAPGQYHCGHMNCGRVYPISNPSALKIGLRAQ